MEWSNETILEFLHLYEMEPVIWNPKNPNHSDRASVAEAWKRIQNTLSINCGVKDLKRKKESLMGGFRALFNKKMHSIKSGSMEVYTPNWFAYDTMERFLGGVYQPRGSTKIGTPNSPPGSTVSEFIGKKTDAQCVELSAGEEGNDDQYDMLDDETQYYHNQTPAPNNQFTEQLPIYASRGHETTIKNYSHVPKKSHLNTLESRSGDEFDAFCRSIAAQLKKLPTSYAYDFMAQSQALITEIKKKSLRNEVMEIDPNTNMDSSVFLVKTEIE